MAIVSAVPGAHYFLNEIVLKDEISFYKTELGLDDEALGNTCRDLEVDRARLQEMIAFCDFVVYPEKAIEYIKNLKENLDSSPPKYKHLPVHVLHALTNLVSTYVNVYSGLLDIIDTLEKDSLEICRNVTEKMRGSSFV